MPPRLSGAYDRPLGYSSKMASDPVFLGAPPGFRTQNLRIKSRLHVVLAGAAMCYSTCSVQVLLYAIVPLVLPCVFKFRGRIRSNPCGLRLSAPSVGVSCAGSRMITGWCFGVDVADRSGCVMVAAVHSSVHARGRLETGPSRRPLGRGHLSVKSTRRDRDDHLGSFDRGRRPSLSHSG